MSSGRTTPTDPQPRSSNCHGKHEASVSQLLGVRRPPSTQKAGHLEVDLLVRTWFGAFFRRRRRFIGDVTLIWWGLGRRVRGDGPRARRQNRLALGSAIHGQPAFQGFGGGLGPLRPFGPL